MDHLITYVAHVVIRGVIYKVIYKLPFTVVFVIGAIACYLVVSRKMRPRRKAKK